MKIQDTELEYTECDEICLRRYLGEYTESMESWATRVWVMCERKANEDPEALGKYDKPLPRVYAASEGQTWQERAQELWANKKQKRKEALCKQFKLEDDSDAGIIKLRDSGKYKTADQLYQEELRLLNA